MDAAVFALLLLLHRFHDVVVDYGFCYGLR